MVTYLSNINDATTDEFDDIPCIYNSAICIRLSQS